MKMLYAIFCGDIRDHELQYENNAVWIFKELDDGKEVIFWHLTSRTVKREKIPRRKKKFYPREQIYNEGGRLPYLRRCERLTWVKPLIEHASEPEVLAWDYEEGNRSIHTYVWIKNADFVLIMKKYPDGKRRLITSFYVDMPYKRKDFERKYGNRIK